MDFQRSRNRRRRIFRDDAEDKQQEALTPSNSSRVVGGTSSGRTYTSGARKSHQLRTTDFVPKRPISLVQVACGLLGLTLLLTLLHVYSTNWTHLGENQLVFAAGSKASLISWFCTLLLFLSAVGCLQIYAFRRHRCDDYRGSYRLWGWLAIGFMVGSACCIASLDTLTGSMFRDTTGWAFLQSGSIFWLIFKLLLLSAIATRVVYETRLSLGTSVILGLSAVFFLVATLLNHSWFVSQFVGSVHAIFETATLWATSLLGLGLLTFARYCYLDAHSLIQHKEKPEPVNFWAKIPRPAWSLPRVSFSMPALFSKKGDTAETADESQSSQSRFRWLRRKSAETSSTAQGEGNRRGLSKKASTQLGSQKTASRGVDSDVIKLSDADRTLLNTDESDIALLSKSDRRRLKKLKKRIGQQAA